MRAQHPWCILRIRAQHPGDILRMYWNGVAATNYIATNEFELHELLKSSSVRCYFK